MKTIFVLATILFTFTLSAQPAVKDDVRAIADRAYVYAYPMVLMEYTRRGAAETNRFIHAAAFPDPRFRQIIRPNADTLYSTGWLDLSKEPMMLHVPDTKGRYYVLQFMDAWTDTFEAPGKRTTGTAERWFAITGPNFTGKLPPEAKRINAPTNTVWLLGRTQTNGASDYETVHGIQHGYWLQPLSAYLQKEPPPEPVAPRRPVAGAITPLQQIGQLTATEFFTLFAQLLVANPPHKGDEAMIRDLARIGIAAGKPFVSNPAIDEAVQSAAKRIAAPDAGSPVSTSKSGWSGFSIKTGRYGTDYAARANVARIGLGALPPEDAIYLQSRQDADGRALNGTQKYVLHFAKDQTPPVNAFWSLTMYSEDGFFVLNPINRFAIGDRDPLKFNADGSLDLYIQSDAPAENANWLPSPAGIFNLSLRIYWPKESVVTGQWTPPGVVKLTATGQSARPDGLYAVIHTSKGTIMARLEMDRTPMTVANFVGLAEGTIANAAFDPGRPFFDGTVYHRVVPGHVIQTGVPQSERAKTPGYTFPNEIHAKLSHNHLGALNMANGGPHTNAAQFCIMLGDRSYLDGDYTVFGDVVAGLDVVQRVVQGDVVETVRIERVGARAQAFHPTTESFNALVDAAKKRVIEQDAKKHDAEAAWIARNYPRAAGPSDGVLTQVITPGKAAAGPARVRYTGKSVRYLGYELEREGDPLEVTAFASDAHGAPAFLAAPETFTAGTKTNPGLDGVIAAMQPGEHRTVIVPGTLGYGRAGLYTPDVPGKKRLVISPFTLLVYDVEMLPSVD